MDHTYHTSHNAATDGTPDDHCGVAATATTASCPPATASTKTCGGGKLYCVICHNYDGKILEDGKVIKMHRIPAEPGPNKTDDKSVKRRKQRKLWIQRIKTVRVDVNITASTRICSQHFAEGVYGGSPEEIHVHLHLDKNVAKPKARTTRTATCRQSYTDTLSSVCDSLDEDPTPEAATCTAPTSSAVGVQVNTLRAAPPAMVDVACQTNLTTLGVHLIRGNDAKTRFYTGFKNWGTFWLLFSTLLSRHGADRLKYWDGEKRSLDNPENRKYTNPSLKKPGKPRSLPLEEEFFMVWLRLRHDIRQTMLDDLFCTSQSTVSRIINTWVNYLYDHMKGLIAWPTREQILSNLPHHFSAHQMVHTILDATEIFCEKPSSLHAQQVTWSDYKSHNTMKIVIGVTPSGMVNFVSRLWGGRASDRHICEHDGIDLNGGFIPRLQPNDVVMADKGFTIADLLPPNTGLNMPQFVSKHKQMTEDEFFTTQQIASPRIVVEMKMEQIKNYRILSSVYELSEAAISEQIVVICAGSTNLLDPLLM